MLKALEMAGFKSFADRTRFEFPQGITVVVGPNGSGKSNIVDAIKWVLGEQSAKSLRGKDMADVIFKGTGSRKLMNAAEATIIFDNSEQRLAIDAPEVHVTRRVYRSGEGEYLINRQPCRLKDVRDLFRGTGVGTDAYSLIEQGKVDRLLQASAKDRRAIFEEAAGISRFKAKKIETQRRLERVDQNLLRLSDIVDEVEGRLRNVRAQATKARRYREYRDRLQELRTQVGMADWLALTERLQELEGQQSHQQQQADQVQAHLELLDARYLEFETDVTTLSEKIRNDETAMADQREKIAAAQSVAYQQTQRLAELDVEAAGLRRNVAMLQGRAGDIRSQLSETQSRLKGAEQQFNQVDEACVELEQAVQEIDARLSQWRRRQAENREQQAELHREHARLENALERLAHQVEERQATVEQSGQRLESLHQALQDQRSEMERIREQDQAAASEQAELLGHIEESEHEITQLVRVLARRQEELANQQGRQTGVEERIRLLEDLEKRHDGVSAGSQRILELAEQLPAGKLGEIHGLVADFVQTELEHATLIDVALGEKSQFVVASGSQLMDQLARRRLKLPSRVGVVALDQLAAVPADTATGDPFSQLEGVIARADHCVRTSAGFESLIRNLLGQTWIVETLEVALRCARQAREQGLWGAVFVTQQGFRVDAPGVMVAGPKEAAAGIVSRRSQLRTLELDLSLLKQLIAEGQAEIQRFRENLDTFEARLQEWGDRQQTLAQQRSQTQVDLSTRSDRITFLQQQTAELAQQRAQSQESVAELEAAQEPMREELVAVADQIQQLESQRRELDQETAKLEQTQRETLEKVSAARVERAKHEQVVATLQARLLQIQQDQQERTRSAEAARQQLKQCRQRYLNSERAILQASSDSALAHWYRHQLSKQVALATARRTELAERRQEMTSEVTRTRRQLQRLQGDLHELELALREVRHERDSLETRMRDDYGIELAELQDEPLEGDALEERQAVDDEIADLRRKITNIGAVNMEALNELDELEERFESLHGQYQDLREAKQALERIIQKINADSRRLFVETLEAIRTNFQKLYRKAFGGGRADIVLEQDVDVLEAGIEIIATPPGKPSFNNSLLSGGEKALTAVALLLAIFEFRPSPFCVLDEVDAPFDEANIGRFVDVLRDFLGWTKFVVVTHSKKTMTAATTLYGVTMQESGVSKQVSVRFEDVTDDGHIRPEALARDSAGARDSSDDGRAA